MKYLQKLLHTQKTVFSYEDIRIILGIENTYTIKNFFVRGVKAGIFRRVYKGIYALEKYDPRELAIKLRKNSYISFETVLQKEGIIFQDYGETLFLASDNTITKYAENKKFIYLKLKNSILQNPLGLENRGNFIIASVERAICDRLYLSKHYYFDTLQGVDLEKLEKVSKIYNKRVILAVTSLIQNAQSRKT